MKTIKIVLILIFMFFPAFANKKATVNRNTIRKIVSEYEKERRKQKPLWYKVTKHSLFGASIFFSTIVPWITLYAILSRSDTSIVYDEINEMSDSD